MSKSASGKVTMFRIDPDITDISLNPNNGKFSPARINGANHASGNRINSIRFRYFSPVMPLYVRRRMRNAKRQLRTRSRIGRMAALSPN